MQTDKILLSTKFGMIGAWLMISVLTFSLFRVDDEYQIFFLLMLTCLWVLKPLPFRQWSSIDKILGLIIIYEVISVFYAKCPVLAINQVFLLIPCFTAYLVFRRLFVSERATSVILQWSYLPYGIALLLSVCSFFIFQKSVLNVGFEDTYHFRFLFRPLGYITNIWAEISLVLLGWFCLVRRHSSLFIFITILSILLSFSRGAYIALGVYVVSFAFVVKSYSEKLRLISITAIAIMIIGVICTSEMQTTLKMNHSISQRQSTDGRISAIRASWNIFQKQPIFGYGSGNYIFSIDNVLNQDSSQSNTSFAPNIIFQILIEKGIVGLVLYLLLAFAIIKYLNKHWKHPNSRVVCCLLLALGVKEMTQSTVLVSPFILLLLSLIIALLQKEEHWVELEDKKESLSKVIIPCFLLMTYLCWIVFIVIQNRNKSYYQQSMRAWENGCFEDSIDLMEKTVGEKSKLINLALLYIQHYRKTAVNEYKDETESILERAEQLQPDDVHIRYLQAVFYFVNNDLDKACMIATELTNNYPKNSIYLLIQSDIYYKKGDRVGALNTLVKAITYTPRLLYSQRISELQQNDHVFYQSLRQRLLTATNSMNNTSTDFARAGYIYKWYGNDSLAEISLQRAVDELPNLATPWLLLGDSSKYRLLIYGAFHNKLLQTNLPVEPDMSAELLFKMNYEAKFRNWYGKDLFIISETEN